VGRIHGELVIWHVDLAGIDRARVLRGWTRGELARRAHVDAGTICDMFRRRRRPALGTLQAISNALGLSLENIIVFGDHAA
jgi:transcriptional regulator with XRE-family HTH domain